MVNWTTEQQNVINARGTDLLVSAAAGSGKTAVLVQRIIEMVTDEENPVDIDKFLVVTFTKAAAAQMKDKIRAALEKLIEEKPDDTRLRDQLNKLPLSYILTIDSFCYKVVREYFYAVSLNPGIGIGDAGVIKLMEEKVLTEVIEEAYANNPDFVSFSEAFADDKNDDNIVELIRKIKKISDSYPDPDKWIEDAISVASISNAEEFDNNKCTKDIIKMYNAKALSIKNKLMKAVEICDMPMGPAHYRDTLLDDITIVDTIADAHNYSNLSDFDLEFKRFSGKKNDGTFDDELAEKVKSIRDKCKKEITAILKAFEIDKETVIEECLDMKPMITALLDTVIVFRQRMLEKMLSENILGYPDIEHYALKILCDGYDENGRGIPSAIGKEMAEGFEAVFIDEYQDSNYLQEAILTSVSGAFEGRRNLFMVGDVKQSIYGFRMARPDLFMNKYKNYPEEGYIDERKIILNKNFRSRESVLSFVNYIFRQIMCEDLGGIDYDDSAMLVPGREYIDYAKDFVEVHIAEKMTDSDNSDDDADASDKKDVDQNLNEELMDMSKVELEATMVADRILRLMGRDGSQPYMVTGEDGELRPIQYRDIVILFRSYKLLQPTFYEILMSRGIPVKLQNEKGVFNSTEIMELISLLKTADNYYDDLQLIATLRGFFCGFDERCLSILAVVKKRLVENKEGLYYYDVIRYLNNNDFDIIKEDIGELFDKYEDDLVEIKYRLSGLFAILAKIDDMNNVKSLDEILRYLLFDTGYYTYVRSMPGGIQRERNIEIFVDAAESLVAMESLSLSDFVRLIDRLMKYEVEFGGDPGEECDEDVVRIMSIHKSKGLEFPVVFVSGTSKQFNDNDSKDKLIVNADYYLSSKFMDLENRSYHDTFMRKGVSNLMKDAVIAEELRLFYVALTRAKEKLIITGVENDLIKAINSYESVTECLDEKEGYAFVSTAKSYLDFIKMALMRSNTFCEAVEDIATRVDDKGNIMSAEYDLEYDIPDDNLYYKVFFHNADSICSVHLSYDEDQEYERKMIMDKLVEDDREAEDIDRKLSFVYDRKKLTECKTKLSVTEIKRLYEFGELEYDSVKTVKEVIYEKKDDEKKYIPKQPAYLSKKRNLNPAEKGTWVHKFMELVPFAEINDKDDAVNFLDEMIKEGRICEEFPTFFSVEDLMKLLSTDLGKRIKKADKKGLLYKEKKFIVGISPLDLLGQCGANDDDNIVTQGIIDAYFEEDDGLVLLDYKTDKVKAGAESELAKEYRIQLKIYKETLEKLTGKPVKESYLYSFAIGDSVKIEDV